MQGYGGLIVAIADKSIASFANSVPGSART
jgi:hypothetical protein